MKKRNLSCRLSCFSFVSICPKVWHEHELVHARQNIKHDVEEISFFILGREGKTKKLLPNRGTHLQLFCRLFIAPS